MKIINYMNFVRQCEPRSADFEKAGELLFKTTVRQFEIAKKYGLPCTFLLQYDVLLDEKYINFFKENADENIELGLWYEIPKQLVDSVGLEWRGKDGWTWDWHIVPGFSMAYSKEERQLLIDSAMNKFKEVFGFFPKSVASWLIDTHTVNRLSEKYGVDYIGICRDQTSTDAYTLIGGYFNGGYYPSKNNMFTPAQTSENAQATPVFRLLGPDPVHNYDKEKYLSSPEDAAVVYTLEPAWTTARREDVVKWYEKTYFENESLNFAYAQIGQENSFFEVGDKMLDALEMQIKIFKENSENRFLTTAQTGRLFKESFNSTPVSSVYASEDWSSGEKIQSLYYDSKKYAANVFRYENRIFLRSLYLFDESVKEKYFDSCCETFDAIYENLPVSDTLMWKDNSGLTLDMEAEKFEVEKIDGNCLSVSWKDCSVIFRENSVEIKNAAPVLDLTSAKVKTVIDGSRILFTKDSVRYAVHVEGARIEKTDSSIVFTGNDIKLCF